MRCVIAVALCVASLAALAAADQSPKAPATPWTGGAIPIFVRAAADTAGFTDPSKERQDSAKDLTAKVKALKTVRLVGAEKDAVILLEVLGRDTRREVNGWALLAGGGQNKSRLTVRLTSGEYSTEFAADGGSSGVFTGYGKAAGKIAEQVEAWVRANRERLVAPAEQKPEK